MELKSSKQMEIWNILYLMNIKTLVGVQSFWFRIRRRHVKTIYRTTQSFRTLLYVQ